MLFINPSGLCWLGFVLDLFPFFLLNIMIYSSPVQDKKKNVSSVNAIFVLM